MANTMADPSGATDAEQPLPTTMASPDDYVDETPSSPPAGGSSPTSSESGPDTPVASPDTKSPPTSAVDDSSTPDKPPSAPLPPRWRFVNEAKKSAGYSSLYAGSYIKGKSADELGAKYTAPDISLYKPAKEEASVNRVSFSLPPGKEVGREENEVGKLSARSWHGTSSDAGAQDVGRLKIREVDFDSAEAPSGSFRGLPKPGASDDLTRKPFKEWDNKVHLTPKEQRSQEWYDGKVRDGYTMPNWGTPGKSFKGVGKIGFHRPGERDNSFSGEVPKVEQAVVDETARTEGIEGDDGREGTLFIHNDGSASNGKADDGTALTEPVDDGNEKKKRRCLYLAVLLLLAIVAVLGAILGKKNNETVAAGAVGGVLIPPITVNETSVPSLFPSASPSEMASEQPSSSPSRECPLGTKAFSIERAQPEDGGLALSTQKGGFTWRIRDACSGEAIAQCEPCPSEDIKDVPLSRPDAPPSQFGRNGPYRRLNGDSLQKITQCLPGNNEYSLEVVASEESSEACCGFDPDTSVISYDNMAIEYRASSGIFGGASSAYFGERGVPCPTTAPSLASSESPSSVPSDVPSPFPTASPSTSPPTQSPVLFLGGCPEPFSSLSAYEFGAQVASYGIVWECRAFPCPRPEGQSLGGSFSSMPPQPLPVNGWEAVGACSGTRAPTQRPTASPSAGPTKSPTPIPTPAPIRTRTPTPFPTPKPTCSTKKDFNLCIAVDMSGSVCNDGSGSQCEGCRATFLPIFFTSECRDSFVDEDTCCDNFARVKDFSTLMVRLLGNFEGDKSFSIVQFATTAQLVSGLDSEDFTVSMLGRLDYTGGMTNHAAAINLCQQTFGWEPSDRQNFILLVTDGVSSEPDIDPEGAAIAEAAAAKDAGSTIIPVFISPSGNDWTALAFMRRLSSNGGVFDVTDFGSLNTLQEELVDQVSCS